MIKYIAIFLAFTSISLGTITDRYVSVSGSGTLDGSGPSNAMDMAAFVDYMTTGGSLTAAAGDRFNLLAGSYARTTNTDTWVNGGSATSPVIIRGYSTIGGDGYQGRTAGGDLVTTNFAAWSWTGGTARLNVTGSWIIIETCSFEAASNSDTVLFNTGDHCVIIRSKITNSGTGGSASCLALQTNGLALDCDIAMTASSGGLRAVGATSGIIDSCRIRVHASQTIPCVSSGANGLGMVIFCTIYAGGGQGLAVTSNSGTCYFRSNTIVSHGGDGIDIITGATKLQKIIGNMITDNGGYGIDIVSSSNAAFLAYNRTRDNTSGAVNPVTDWGTATTYGHITTDTGGASTDYNNSGSNDYRLIPSSPATSAGIPELQSIGALQRNQTGTGTAATFIE